MRPLKPGYWIGHPGALLPLPGYKGELTRSTERAATYKTSASGQRRAYLAARRAPLREWKVTMPWLWPQEYAALYGLIMNTDPPYVWVEPWAMVTNLLTPAAAQLDGTSPGLSRLGRQPLADGTWAATAGSNPTGATVNIPPAPVTPDLPVTVSAYLGSSSSASVAALFLDTNAAVIGAPISSDPVSGLGLLSRASVTVLTPPSNAAAVALRVSGASVLAQPAVTWTSELMPYGPGGGAPQVLVTGLDEKVEWAVRAISGERRATLTFTVTEVG